MLKKFTIDSVVNGEADQTALQTKGQFLYSESVDPELKENTSNAFGKASLGLIPTRSVTVSGAGMNTAPMWILTNPVNELIYTYCTNGELISYSSAFTETVIGTPTNGAGNGMAFYNDYMLLATPTEISAYGPLSGVPAITNTIWNGTFGLTLLTNTTYPSNGTNTMPNHPMHTHVDNKCYIGDYAGGRGLIHFFKTQAGTITNDGSTYNALDLPFGYFPTDIESFGTDLAILAMQGTSTSIKQGKAALFLWDTVSPSFYRQIDLPDATASALQNINGILNIYCGAATLRTSVYRYDGGYSVTLIDQKIPATGQNGFPPFAGAVDSMGSRQIFSVGKQVRAVGYVNSGLPTDAKNNILVDNNNATISSLRYYAQSSDTALAVLIGSATGLQRISTASGTFTSKWYSEQFNIGSPFSITRVLISLYDEVSADTSLLVKLIVDEQAIETTIATINNTNYPSKKFIEITPQGSTAVSGKYNFYLGLEWASTTKTSIKLPIIIEADITPPT